jgi:hypothetical protein
MLAGDEQNSPVCPGQRQEMKGAKLRIQGKTFILQVLTLLYFPQGIFFLGGGGNGGLNSGLHTCKIGTLLLESHLQSIFALVILKMGSSELFAWIGLEP